MKLPRWCNLLTYLLTSCSTVLLEKLTVSQLVNKFPASYGTPKVHYLIHKCPSPVSILSQPHPVHTPHIPLPEGSS